MCAESRTGASQPSIRPAIETDAPALGALHVQAWQWAYRGLLADAYLDGLAEQTTQRTEMWRQQIQAPPPGRAIWVAERGEQLVGFCNTAPSGDGADAAELLTLYLDPEVVGTGVGAALMRHVMADLRGRGYRTAILWVLDTNERARRFYERGGWRADGATRTDEVWGVAVREVRYRIDFSE